MKKTSTDIFWNERASVNSAVEVNEVNISDLPQREIETRFIEKQLDSSSTVLEVGCGNGFLSQRLASQVKKVFAFDYSENMIAQAKENHQKDNIEYFHDNLLAPQSIPNEKYDVIVCVRVLINLEDIEEQKKAICNLTEYMHEGTKLILIEGFKEGFENINLLREELSLDPLKPASINFYSSRTELMQELSSSFDCKDKMHTGMFDMMTRVVNPLLNGANNATGPSEFHRSILPLCLTENPDAFHKYARLHGFVFTKK